MGHGLFQEDVYLEPDKHQYFDKEGNEYLSFSALYGKLVKKFDADMIASNIAKNGKESADDLKAKWNKTAVQGTRFDNALERFYNTGTILESDEDLRDAIPKILEKYKVYSKVFHQVCVYDKEYLVAGSTDSTCIVTNRSDSRFHKGDWKCFEKGVDSLFVTNKSQPFLKAPFEHLANTKFTKISFQLSYYARLFEKLTGRKCERLFIDLIVPKWDSEDKLVSYENHVVNVNYLKNDIGVLLDYFKEEIGEMLLDRVDLYPSSDDEIF